MRSHPRFCLPILMLALALIASCTAIRIGYRHADTFLAWRADEYFDFDTRQKRDFAERMDRLLAWHRYEQLPEYAVFVDTAIKKIQPALKREDIVWFIDGIASRYRIVVRRGVPDAAETLATLTPEQLVALQKQWDKDNRRFTREHALGATPAKRKLERQKRMLDQITDWTGNLTTDQEHKIALLIETIPHISPLRYEDRIRRQKEFLELLKLRTDKHEFQPKLQAWLLDWEHGRTAEYARVAHEVYEKRIQFYIAVDKLLIQAQRQAVMHRLQEFAEDFDALSKKSAKTASYPDSAATLALFCVSGRYACLPE